ncbi:MAG: Asp-tRNA(Asn)/Glu-tRNA(Gln) amidotransferase GatCAB subunit B, partial [Erysipelotrichales bacterium]|nr:Asp-tRNA(Asn)/Glu-tRNA(Gln) amidotransferase GatCAB subunit B [Erysipelotrichales bacterium]
DVNISLSTYIHLGTNVEIKNLNSIGNVQKSIEYEFQRQIELLENNQKVIQETRRYDEKLHKTITMRLKEKNVDYCYYREPNIPSIRLDQQWIDNIQKKLPIMPMELKKIFLETFRLTHKQAEYLINHKDIASFFKQTIQYSSYYENIIHWLLGDVVAYLNKNHMTIEQTMLKPQYFGELISLLKDEILSTKQGKIVLQKMLVEPISPTQVIQEFNFKQITDEDIIIEMANTLLDEHKELVDLYRKGKNNVLGFFVGQIMKKTKGQANPRKTNDVLLRLLKEKV